MGLCRKTLVDAVGEQEAAKLYPKDSIVIQENSTPALEESPTAEDPVGADPSPTPANTAGDSAGPQDMEDDPLADQPVPAVSSPSAHPASGDASEQGQAASVAASDGADPSSEPDQGTVWSAAIPEDQLEDGEEDGEVLSDAEEPAEKLAEKPAQQSLDPPIQLRLASQPPVKPDAGIDDGQGEATNVVEPETIAVELITTAKTPSTGISGSCMFQSSTSPTFSSVIKPWPRAG